MSAFQAGFFDDLPITQPATRKPAKEAPPAAAARAPIPAAPEPVPVVRAEPVPREPARDPMRFLPARPIPWLNLLAKCATPPPITICIAANRSGVTLEALFDEDAGRWLLQFGGDIIESGQHGGPRGRLIYLNQQQGLDLHAKAPLVPKDGVWGTLGGSFRFAEPGDDMRIRTGAIISGFRAKGDE